MKKYLPVLIVISLSIALVLPAGARESKFFFKASGGGSYPMLRNLEDELDLQGDEKLSIGYSAGISLGRTFFEGQWETEAYFTVSRYPSIHYVNAFEDFEGDATHYGFGLILKKCFRPESEKFVPYAGIGIGYGKTSFVSGGGQIDGFEGLVLLQLEHKIKHNISFLAECLWSPAFAEERYSSPFLEESNEDVILDSDENPLNDGFSSVDFRIGVKIWLRPPRK